MPKSAHRRTVAALTAAVLAPSAGAFTGTPDSGSTPATERTSLTAGTSPDPLALRCIGGLDAWAARDEIEPHVAASPVDADHLVAAWMLRGHGGPGAMQASWSADGGATWSDPMTLPMGECAGGGAGGRYVSDPWVSIDAEGRAYVSGIEWAPGDDGADAVSRLVVAVSDSGGAGAWKRSVLTDHATSGAGLDNTAVMTSPDRQGMAYVTATRFADGVGPAGLSRTEDGGRTWTPLTPTPVHGADALISLAPQPLVGAQPGELWIAYSHDPRGAYIAVMRSRDGGETWEDPVPVASWTRGGDWPLFPGTAEELEVAPDIISAGIDRSSGRLWIAHQSSRPDGTATVVLAGSADGGRTWSSTPLLDPGEIGWRPTLAVTADGRVGVTWFAPAGEPADGAYPTSVELAILRPGPAGSAELVERQTLDRFDWVPRRTGARFLGDYHGMAASGRHLVAVYSRSVETPVRVYVVRASAGSEDGR